MNIWFQNRASLVWFVDENPFRPGVWIKAEGLDENGNEIDVKVMHIEKGGVDLAGHIVELHNASLKAEVH